METPICFSLGSNILHDGEDWLNQTIDTKFDAVMLHHPMPGEDQPYNPVL